MFDEFISWFASVYSPASARVYRSSLQGFAAWFELQGEGLTPENVLTSDLRAYQEHLQQEGRKPGTIRTRMKHIRAWLKWAGQDVRFPKPPAVQPAPPKALDRLALRRLIRAVEKFGNKRDMALVRLLAFCGLRVSETVGLKVGDLDFGERHGTATVHGKGNKTRMVPVPPETRRAVQEWLAEKPAGEWVFPGRKGHMSARTAWDVVAKYAKMAGVECHPHSLRHTAATAMLRGGTDIVTVAGILGHASITTTAIYTKPSLDEMAAAIERGEQA